MMGLNLTHQAICSHDEVERIGKLGTAAGRTIHGMLTRPRAARLGTTGHPMHDPCVIAYLLWPELFEGRDCFVEVETGAGPLRGRTTVDWNGRLQRPANALVMDKVDAPKMFARMIDLIATLP
jgi:purine nucleosidase